MRVIDLIKTASEHLKEKGFDNARLEVEKMLACVLGLSRMNLYMNYDRPLKEEELEKFRAFYKRRIKREPLQYIIGTSGFREIEVKTDRRALIPRPETELLVEHAIEYLKPLKTPVVADLGTGSGVIAISVAYEVPGASIVAADISAEALALARYNSGLLGFNDSIRFVQRDMFETLAEYGKFNAIVSNPPYVKSGTIKKLDAEVRDFEPVLALDGGTDGMSFLRRLAEEAFNHLLPGGLLIMECDGEQADSLAGIMESSGEYEHVTVIKDYSGRQRIVKGFCRAVQ